MSGKVACMRRAPVRTGTRISSRINIQYTIAGTETRLDKAKVTRRVTVVAPLSGWKRFNMIRSRRKKGSNTRR